MESKNIETKNASVVELKKIERNTEAKTRAIIQVYDALAPRTAKLFNQCHQVLVRNSARAAKSESVLPLLTQGIIQLMDVGSEIAKTKLEPFINELRESGRKH
jgi:hypothetical protein